MVVEVQGQTYHIDKILIKKWDSIKDGKLTKIDEDRVYVVDGRERSGKSVFALQQAAYIDPSLATPKGLNRVTFSYEETLEAIREAKSTKDHTTCIVFDEAFRGLSSRSVLSKANKVIVQALMEMGQNNLVLWIVLPSFFMLDSYPAIHRSHALFRITKDKNSRTRRFKVYNEFKKQKLYNMGFRKGFMYNYPTYIRGKFFNKYPGGDEFEKLYRKKKFGALTQMNEELVKKDKASRFEIQRNKLIYRLWEDKFHNYRKTRDHLKELGVELHSSSVGLIIKKVKEAIEQENSRVVTPEIGLHPPKRQE